MLVYIRQDDHRALKCPREPSGTCGHTSLLLSWKATLCTLTKGLGFIKERMPVPNENYYYNTLQTILLHAPLVEKWRRYSHLRFAFETHRNYVTCCESHTDLITFTEMKKVTPLNKTIITKIILMSVSSFSELDMSLSILQEWAMDKEAWRAAVHGVTKSRTWLSNWTENKGGDISCPRK